MQYLSADFSSIEDIKHVKMQNKNYGTAQVKMNVYTRTPFNVSTEGHTL